ncbi:MAG: hypothetical protein B9S34_03140 [Opitutia bacterium Tous-C1TDCM]|nr:MAG: hypothetical protein B9S34_03140 [Opitutae bacterium Tous-C1TDCM]
MSTLLRAVTGMAVGIWAAAGLRAADVAVRDAAGLRAAVAAAVPGTRVLLAGGNYGAGFHFANLRGAPGRPIVLAAADPAQPPVFQGDNTGLHLSAPAHVEVDGLVFTGHAANGVNIDDTGGEAGGGAHHVVLRRLRVGDIGGDGNHDGIKLSGVSDFQVSGCTIERWGTRGGSAIDLVGCRRGLIADNTIRHRVPAPGNCTGVQAKGGSEQITIRRNRFESAGGRAVNIGGSTGLPYFRPALGPGGGHAEARAIRVEGNTFVGGVAALAFVGVDGAVVRFNTILRPERWVFRILQETRAPDFVPCRGGEFADNVVVFASAQGAAAAVNVGPGTAPETFTLARNWWYAPEAPERSAPVLPVPERDGVVGRDPASAAAVAGAEAFRMPE